ncbi:MAG TPA: MarR family transcriptional regulator [Devosia sp.]|jgi:DNA-binding MarR family transcriptional regulator|nr:MarR family transcriptional regulator [Devosia sp.]
MPNNLKLEEQLCFSLYAANHAFTRFYRQLLEPIGLTYPQYLVLLTLWEEDGLPLNAIGDRLGLDSGTLTPLLRRMEAAGHVTRRRDEADERVVRVHLTAAGKRLRRTAETFPRQIGTALQCSAAEANALRRLLVSLRGDLEAA